MKKLQGQMATTLDQSSIEHLLSASGGHSDRGDGGALLYLFELPEGSLLFQDTSGHWSSILGELRPDVAILAAAGRANIDGEPVQGSLADFVAEEARTLATRQRRAGTPRRLAARFRRSSRHGAHPSGLQGTSSRR